MDFWSLALDVLLDTLKDSCIIFAIVLTLHVLLSFFEGKLASLLKKNKRYAPVLGSLFGIVPECGTSVVGADLYLKGHLTMGTLIAIFLACSGVDMPKPMAQGISVFFLTTSTIEARSVFISVLVPVTPRLDTIYKKPSASFAIMEIRFSDVGAIREIRSTPYL